MWAFLQINGPFMQWLQVEINMRDFYFFNKYLDYDLDSGQFTYRPRGEDEFPTVREFKRWNTRYANQPAGGYYVRPDGYKMLRIRVCWGRYVGSRVAAVLCGILDDYDDPRQIDHIDGDPTNNVYANLRAVDSSINGRNRKIKRTNKTGITGVQRAWKSNGWLARINYDGENLYLGYYGSLFEAACARRSAELKCGYTARHGR